MLGVWLVTMLAVDSPWLERREALRTSIWPGGKPPEHATPLRSVPANVTGMTRLVWNVSEPVLPMHATVFHYVRQVSALSSCVVLTHTGHDWTQCRALSCHNGTATNTKAVGDCSSPSCEWWDNDAMTSFIHNELGCDAYFLYMPLRGPNHQFGYPFPHEFFRNWHARGVHTLRFFIEPTYLTVTHALELGYRHVHLMGKSGGAWTATVAAAVDPRVSATLTVSGTLPWFIKERGRSDFEQKKQRRNPNWYLSQVNFTTIYLLAALEPRRGFVQVLHERDTCCFKARGHHAPISFYNQWVDAQLAACGSHGMYATVVTNYSAHEYNKQDREVLVAALRQITASASTFEHPSGVRNLLSEPDTKTASVAPPRWAVGTQQSKRPWRAISTAFGRRLQVRKSSPRSRRALSTAGSGRACVSSACRARRLGSIDYLSMVLPPKQVNSSNKWIMNFAGQGHVDLAAQLSAEVGLGPIVQGLEAAKDLHARGHRFVYMTLTNDHRPRTQREHGNTLAWERTLSGSVGDARFIGPPGMYTADSWVKKMFCNMSESIGRIDPALRFGLPCAFGNAKVYKALLDEQERSPLNTAGRSLPPRWLVRQLRGRGVVAFGSGMRVEVLSHDKVKADPKLAPHNLEESRTLLLRFLDPPMLHRGVHLGTPVSTRWDTRIFGMVQWEPLRVWISSHGLIRGGSPWKNYTSNLPLDQKSRLLWELSAALDPRCDPLPRERVPWVDPARFSQCAATVTDKKKGSRQPDGCCVCQTVADTLDLEHDQRGFATTGSLRKMDHIATDHGIDPRVLRRSMDEAITRYLVMMQKYYQAEADGKRLSRWNTPMAIDVAFGADGRAYVYEGHLVPNWKRAGHFFQPFMDREYAWGAYSPLLLAASHLLVSPALEKRHEQLLGDRVAEADRPQLLEFLRDQGVASALGFRRAWPSPRHTEAARYASKEDQRFAAQVEELGLLLPGIDALESPVATTSDLLKASFWNFRGKLYTNESLPQLKCEESQRVLASWSSAAHAAV
tara:strand:- start:297 stop:3341 length:3045 start_codon:yes stop_codon:yes gene_type:complete